MPPPASRLCPRRHFGQGHRRRAADGQLTSDLRSRYAIALDDLPRLLKSVNQPFYENTPMTVTPHSSSPSTTTTRRAGIRQLRPQRPAPLPRQRLARAARFPHRRDRHVRRLGCVTRRFTLAPGELRSSTPTASPRPMTLRATSSAKPGLIETVRACLSLPPAGLVAGIQNAVQKFQSFGEQSDDLNDGHRPRPARTSRASWSALRASCFVVSEAAFEASRSSAL